MTRGDFIFEQASQLGTYKAIAEMMRNRIRIMNESTDDFSKQFSMDALLMLCEQLDEVQDKMKSRESAIANEAV